MKRGFWFLRAIKFVIFLALFLLIGGCITMSLWNWLIPELFNGPVITFWQTIGLLLLSKILFGGFGKGFCGGRGRRDKWSGRWGNDWNNRCGMSKEEWKERMKEKWKGKAEGMSAREWKEQMKEEWKAEWKAKIEKMQKEWEANMEGMSDEEKEKFKKKFKFTIE